MKHFNHFELIVPRCQVVPVAGQSEQPQGVRAHHVPPPEDQALPDPPGQWSSHGHGYRLTH